MTKAFWANTDLTTVIVVDITADHGSLMSCTVPSGWEGLPPKQNVPLPVTNLHRSFGEAKEALLAAHRRYVECKKNELRHAEERLAKVEAQQEPEMLR